MMSFFGLGRLFLLGDETWFSLVGDVLGYLFAFFWVWYWARVGLGISRLWSRKRLYDML